MNQHLTPLINAFVEEATENKEYLIGLKKLAVQCKQFELAANLRDMENLKFPKTEEQTVAENKAAQVNLLLRMVELDVPHDVCWLINAAIELHRKKPATFGLKDACMLIAKRKELFPNT